jgi:hypothetical protein
MNGRNAVLPATAMFCVLAAMQLSASPTTTHRTLRVKLNYTGARSVDENHRIYVLLFDSNPITASSLVDSTSEAAPPPAASGVSHILRRCSASRRNDTVTFDYLSSSPVYAAAFIDQNGTYDGHSEPIPGAPMGLYKKAPNQIEPITLKERKRVKVVLAFDDSTRIP